MVASVCCARASEVAPADEYFGPFHVSILEIRNRLAGFEREPVRALARDVRGLNNLELAIVDWYRHYPHDPWIPGFERRLHVLFARAHHR